MHENTQTVSIAISRAYEG